MKLIITIVQDQDLLVLREDLTSKGYRVTKLASTGGFLQSGNSTLIIGVEDHEVDDVLSIIAADCKAREVNNTYLSPTVIAAESFIPFGGEITVGGATVFVIDVEQYIRY